MANLRVDPGFLLERLFSREIAMTHKIHGVRIDGATGDIVLEIKGPQVPAGAEDILAIVHREERIEFQAVNL